MLFACQNYLLAKILVPYEYLEILVAPDLVATFLWFQMPGFGTNSAMGSSSLPARVEYNTSNDFPAECIYDQGFSYPATNEYAYYAGMGSSSSC